MAVLLLYLQEKRKLTHCFVPCLSLFLRFLTYVVSMEKTGGLQAWTLCILREYLESKLNIVLPWTSEKPKPGPSEIFKVQKQISSNSDQRPGAISFLYDMDQMTNNFDKP